jgi:hypothetical protein
MNRQLNTSIYDIEFKLRRAIIERYKFSDSENIELGLVKFRAIEDGNKLQIYSENYDTVGIDFLEKPTPESKDYQITHFIGDVLGEKILERYKSVVVAGIIKDDNRLKKELEKIANEEFFSAKKNRG